MFAINDAAKAKKSARALEKFLKKHGHGLGHGQALNAVAAMAGFEDWNGMQAQLKDAPAAVAVIPNIWDVDFSKVNIVNVYGSDYAIDDLDDFHRVAEWLPDWTSAENPLRDKNPIALRLASQNEDAYGSVVLRVKDLLAFEWDTTQRCFVSAEQSRMSLYTLAPYEFTAEASKTDPVTQASSGKKPVHAEPTILDVDFSRVTGMKKGGEGFWVDSSYYAEALDWLNDWNNPANENDPDVPVLELTYIDDHGFAAHTQILANELLALKWSPSLGAFVNPEGVEYAFTAEQSIIPGTLPRCLPVKVTAVSEAKASLPNRDTLEQKIAEAQVSPPKRYTVEVYSIDSGEESCSGREHEGCWDGTAYNEREAEAKAIAQIWDETLEQSGAEPSCDVTELADEQDGPFSILVAEGHSRLNASPSFAEAWRLGFEMSKRYKDYSCVVQVVTSDWQNCYTFDKK